MASTPSPRLRDRAEGMEEAATKYSWPGLDGRTKGEIDQGLLLDLVGLGRAGGGRCACTAFHAQNGTVAGEATQLRHDVGKGSHVGGLFLDPDDVLRVGVLVESGLELGFGKGIQLLDEDDADRHVFALGSLDAEIVADLSGADEKATRVDGVVVR